METRVFALQRSDFRYKSLEVDSAFGGLAIYPREAVEGLMYVGLDASGNEICEHVQFSMNIGKKRI